MQIYCTQSKTFVKIPLKDFDFTELRENAGPLKCQNMFFRLRMFMLKLWDAKKTYDKTKPWRALPEESAHADATAVQSEIELAHVQFVEYGFEFYHADQCLK